MAAIKSGNHIIINSGNDNTLASVTADIDDPTYIEETAPGVFVVKGNRYFQVYPTATFTIGDPDDFTVEETLAFEPVTNGSTRVYLPYYGSGHFRMFGKATLDLSNGLYRYANVYVQGQFTCQGDGVNNPTIKNGYYFYIYGLKTAIDYEAEWDNGNFLMEHANVGPMMSTSYANCFYFLSSYLPFHSFVMRDVVCDFNPGVEHVRGVSRAIECTGQHGVDYSTYVFERVTFTKCYDAVVTNGANLHFKDCDFVDNAAQLRIGGASAPVKPDLHRPAAVCRSWMQGIPKSYPQTCTFFDGCKIEAGFGGVSGAFALQVLEGADVLLRDTHILSGGAGAPVYLTSNSRLFLWTGNTMTIGTTGSTLVLQTYTGQVYWVFALDLLIVDSEAQPVADASVTVRQGDGYEEHSFFTGSDGRPLGFQALEGKILCISAASEAANLPDIDNPIYQEDWVAAGHAVTVSHKDFDTATKTYTMDQDRSDTIVMTTDTGPTTVEAKTLDLESPWA